MFWSGIREVKVKNILVPEQNTDKKRLDYRKKHSCVVFGYPEWAEIK